ncbi:MAG: hypothetical protein NTW29_19195 [Bacteroidetes bacterium]|nr:hypothetical protein [Bacteroidota bacterium]
MKIIFLLLAGLYTLSVNAQTRLIAYKSHSGNMEQFSTALELNLFDIDASNFGLPSTLQLDSVILIKKSVAVVVTSRGEGAPVFRQRDTLRSKSLFNKKISIDTLKKNIHKLIRFDNPADSIRFIGFGKEEVSSKMNGGLFYFSHNHDRYNPFDGMAVFISGLILLASLLAGWIAWRWKYSGLRPVSV